MLPNGMQVTNNRDKMQSHVSEVIFLQSSNDKQPVQCYPGSHCQNTILVPIFKLRVNWAPICFIHMQILISCKNVLSHYTQKSASHYHELYHGKGRLLGSSTNDIEQNYSD